MYLKKILLIFLIICVCLTLLLFSYEIKNIKKEPKPISNKKITFEITTNCTASFLLWLVTSYSGNRKKRDTFRKTYLTADLESLGIQRIFLLAKKDGKQENAILEESQIFQDIIVGNFTEAYRNLTYKHLMGLNYVLENCPRVSFVMKMDDDIALNLYEILSLIKLKLKEADEFIMGHAFREMKPVRDPKNKWFVTNSEFRGDVYPNFVSGWLYVTNPKTVGKLMDRNQEKRFEYFWIDDVFITGILRNEAGVEIVDIGKVFATDYRFLECCIEGGLRRKLKCEFFVGPDGAREGLIERFKEFAEFCHREECFNRTIDNFVGKTCVAVIEEQRNFEAPGNAIVEVLT